MVRLVSRWWLSLMEGVSLWQGEFVGGTIEIPTIGSMPSRFNEQAWGGAHREFLLTCLVVEALLLDTVTLREQTHYGRVHLKSTILLVLHRILPVFRFNITKRRLRIGIPHRLNPSSLLVWVKVKICARLPLSNGLDPRLYLIFSYMDLGQTISFFF